MDKQVKTIVDCSNPKRTYGVIVADSGIDIESAVREAKEIAVSKYPDCWSLDDILAELNFEHDFYPTDIWDSIDI